MGTIGAGGGLLSDRLLEEAVIGESSVAAPICDDEGDVIAAVAVVMPATEWPPTEAVLNDLREAARNVSRELGAPAWPPRAPAAAAPTDA
jgi:hypothetical protein